MNLPQRADSLLNAAMSIAETIGDTIEYVFAIQNLMKKDIHLKQYKEAYRLVQHVLSLDSQQFLNATFYIYAADVYANLQKPDSAEILLAKADEKSIHEAIDRLAYLDVKKDIALARGDTDSSRIYETWVTRFEDSLFSSSIDLRHKLTAIDYSVTQQSHNLLKKREHSLIWKLFSLLALVAILLILSIPIYIKKHRYQELAKELSKSYKSQYQELVKQQKHVNALNIKDSELKEFIASNINMLQIIIEECYHGASIVQIKHKIEETVQFQKDNNSDHWLKLFTYIDLEYNNIMSITKKNYPNLRDKELLLLALTTLECSCLQIATILGYSNVSSIGPARQRLSKKMNLDGSISDYIRQFNNSTISSNQ